MMGKVYAADISNLNVVSDTAPEHRQNPENFYPEMTMQMMFDFLDSVRRRVGQVMTDRAILLNPQSLGFFDQEEVVSEFYDNTDATADDKQRGYYGQFINCPVVVDASIPQDVVACAQLYPNEDSGYRIVSMCTSFVGEYSEQNNAESDQ